MPIYKKIDTTFFKAWSPEMAYVLGFLFADGNVVCSKRNTWFWSIQITDRALLFAIKKVLHSDHAIAQRKQIRGHKQLYRLQIGRKEMCEDLLGHGVTVRKSLTMRLPSIPIVYGKHFLRGYFDGDGHVWVGSRRTGSKRYPVIQTGFTSGSKLFLEEFRRYLASLCELEGGSIVNKERGFELRYSVFDSLKIYKTMYNSEYGTLYLPRKKRIFEKFISLRT